MADFTNTDDVIDVRDVIARVEELREGLQIAMDENEEGHTVTELAEYVQRVRADASAAHQHRLWDEAVELQTLESLLEEIKGYGGDEQWEGDWYPVTLIRDSYFEESMDEMVADCYEIPKDLPSFMTITLDYEALQQDYFSVEFDGVTYWYR